MSSHGSVIDPASARTRRPPMALDPARVCIVRTPDMVGSGYLVDDVVVLTAAHVVGDHKQIDVTIGAGETTEQRVRGVCRWSRRANGIDLAIVGLQEGVGEWGAAPLGRVR